MSFDEPPRISGQSGRTILLRPLVSTMSPVHSSSKGMTSTCTVNYLHYYYTISQSVEFLGRFPSQADFWLGIRPRNRTSGALNRYFSIDWFSMFVVKLAQRLVLNHWRKYWPMWLHSVHIWFAEWTSSIGHNGYVTPNGEKNPYNRSILIGWWCILSWLREHR